MKDELDRARRTLISHSTLVPRTVLAAIGVGAAFGLGILVGGIGDARGASPSKDVLDAARARTEVFEQKRSELKLAFPAELLADEPKPGLVVASPASTAPIRPSDKAATDRPATDKALGAPGAREASTTGSDDAEPAPVKPTSGENRARIQSALAKVLGASAAAPAPLPVTRSFALQVASVPERAGAEAMASKLAAQGLKARVVVGEVGGREVYRVRVGSFAERDKAEAAKSKLAMPSFIVSE